MIRLIIHHTFEKYTSFCINEDLYFHLICLLQLSIKSRIPQENFAIANNNYLMYRGKHSDTEK